MTIRDLRTLLEECNDDAKILYENPYTDEKIDFDSVMNVYIHNDTVVFYTT